MSKLDMDLASLPHDDQQDSIIRLCIAMIILPVVFTCLRFWSRTVTSRGKYGWDDWLCLLALIMSVADTALFIWTVQVLGLGKHIWDIPPKNITRILKASYASYFLFNSGVLFSKLSALAFYARIFSAYTRFKRVLWMVGAFCWAWWLFETGYNFACTPVYKAWEPTAEGHCVDTFVWYIIGAVWDSILDIVILSLPLPMIWQLQMPSNQKWLLICLFIIGYSSLVTSLGRMGATIHVNNSISIDATYTESDVFSWSVAEVPACIVAICLPAVFYLIRRGYRSGISSLFTGKECPVPLPADVMRGGPKRTEPPSGFARLSGSPRSLSGRVTTNQDIESQVINDEGVELQKQIRVGSSEHHESS